MVVRAQVSFGSVSGAAEDIVTNTFHFDGPSDPASLENVFDMLSDFYKEPFTTTTLVGYMPATRFDGSMRMRAYDLTDAMPRPPRHERLETFSPAGGAQLPGEVALVMSYFAEPLAGVPRGRLRGRIYLGPLTDTTNSAQGRPTDAVVNSLCESGAELGKAAQASLDYEWVVYSPTAGQSYAVERVRVDNEFDTMRSRGVRGTEFAQASQGVFTPI